MNKLIIIILSFFILLFLLHGQIVNAQDNHNEKIQSTVDQEFNNLKNRIEKLIEINKLAKADMLLKSAKKYRTTNMKALEELIGKYKNKEKMLNLFISFAVREARNHLKNGNFTAAQHYIDKASDIAKYMKINKNTSAQIENTAKSIKLSVEAIQGIGNGNLTINNKYRGMKIRQFIVMIILYIIGALSFCFLTRKTDIVFICFAGFPLGLALWGASSILLLILKLPYHMIFPILIIACLISLIIAIKNTLIQKRDIIVFGFSVLAFAVFDYILCTYRYAVFSGDSFGIINRGRAIYFCNGFYNDVLRAGLGKNGVFTYIVQSIAPLIEVNYIYAAMPLLSISLLFSMSYFIFRCSLGFNLNLPVRIIASIIAPLCLATTDMFAYHSFYIHSNLVSGVYLFLFVSTAFLGLSGKNYSWFIYSLLFLFSFAICRCEAPIFALIVIIVFMSFDIPYKIKLGFVLLFAIITMFWFGYLALILKDAKFVTPIRIAIMIVPILACALLAYAAKWKIFDRLLKALPWVMIYFLIFAAGILILIKPVWMADNFIGIVENMFASYWGCFWMASIVMALFSMFWEKLENETLFTITIACFLILLFAIGFARPRVSYFQGIGDSSNRMLIHIAPLVITYISLKYLKRISKAT